MITMGSWVEHGNVGGGIIFASWEVNATYRPDATVDTAANQSPAPKSAEPGPF